MGKHFRDFYSRFSITPEFKGTSQQNIVVVGLMNLHPIRMRLAVSLGQFWFWIEQIHLAGAAVLDQLDHGFCRTGEVTRSRTQVAMNYELMGSRISPEHAI